MNIILLSYSPRFDITLSRELLALVTAVSATSRIDKIVWVDNYNLTKQPRNALLCGVPLVEVPGDNTCREFTGYLRGLDVLREELTPRTILLNDTFTAEKHHPRTLLLPALLRSLSHPSCSPILWGELNRAPFGSRIADQRLTHWISTYCLFFSQVSARDIADSIEKCCREAGNSLTDFNKRFETHFLKYIRSRASYQSTQWREDKYRATKVEVLLSAELERRGVALQSLYGPNQGMSLFTRNTLRRVSRKLDFLRGG